MLKKTASKSTFQGFPDDKIYSFYFLYGEDHPLLKKHAQALLDQLIPVEYRDGNYIYYTGKSFDPVEITDFCDTIPFLYNRRIIQVDDCPLLYESKKTNQAMEDTFITWLENNKADPSTFTIIFTLCDDGDKISLKQTSKLYKFLVKNGFVAQFPLPEEINEFIQTVARMKTAKSLQLLDELYKQGIATEDICYGMMTRIRYSIRRDIDFNVSNNKLSNLKYLLHYYLDTLDVENRLRPRAQDLFSEDPQNIIEQWILQHKNTP